MTEHHHEKELRVLAKALPEKHGTERLLILARMGELAQMLSDAETVELARPHGGQQAMADGLGISKQAVSLRVAHARQRRAERHGGGS